MSIKKSAACTSTIMITGQACIFVPHASKQSLDCFPMAFMNNHAGERSNIQRHTSLMSSVCMHVPYYLSSCLAGYLLREIGQVCPTICSKSVNQSDYLIHFWIQVCPMRPL